MTRDDEGRRGMTRDDRMTTRNNGTTIRRSDDGTTRDDRMTRDNGMTKDDGMTRDNGTTRDNRTTSQMSFPALLGSCCEISTLSIYIYTSI